MSISKMTFQPGQKYVACVWGPDGWYITKRKAFKTLEGAERYANKRVEEPAVIEVTIIMKDKSRRSSDWPWVQVARIKNPNRQRILDRALLAKKGKK